MATAAQNSFSSSRVGYGLVLAFLAFAVFAWSDAFIKFIEAALNPFEIAFFGAVFGLMALPFLKKRDDRWSDVVRTTNRPLWMLRFFASAAGAVGSVAAFSYLPMAEAFSLIFLMPAFVTIMSVVFLKEKVGIRRWGAVILGFIGTLIILRPGFRELHVGHLGAIVGGLSAAISIVIFRAMGPREKSLSLYGAGVLGWLSICTVAMIPFFVMPTPEQWFNLAGYGLLAALANVLMMKAAAHAPAAYVAPTQYSQMLWALVIGYFFFGEVVDLPMVIGIVLIVASGLLTILRERQRRTPLPPPLVGDPQAGVAVTPQAD